LGLEMETVLTNNFQCIKLPRSITKYSRVCVSVCVCVCECECGCVCLCVCESECVCVCVVWVCWQAYVTVSVRLFLPGTSDLICGTSKSSGPKSLSTQIKIISHTHTRTGAHTHIHSLVRAHTHTQTNKNCQEYTVT